MDATKAAALVKDFQGGNKEAFGILYDEFIKPIYNFIYYKTHHRETAEDLTSQTFIKAYRAARSFDESKGTFSAWLYQIARHTVIDHYRQTKPALNIEDAWDLESKEDVFKTVAEKIELEKVKGYLKTLTGEQREIVLLRIWEQMSYAEIADIMNKSEASCKMMFSRTMKTLRENLPQAMAIIILGLIGRSM